MDNNVISNYFSGCFAEKSMDFIADVIDQIPNISVITEIEALSWVTAIVYNLTPITSDIDFNNIEGLNIIDPHNL